MYNNPLHLTDWRESECKNGPSSQQSPTRRQANGSFSRYLHCNLQYVFYGGIDYISISIARLVSLLVPALFEVAITTHLLT
jgi:hypothetical protein